MNDIQKLEFLIKVINDTDLTFKGGREAIQFSQSYVLLLKLLEQMKKSEKKDGN